MFVRIEDKYIFRKSDISSLKLSDSYFDILGNKVKPAVEICFNNPSRSSIRFEKDSYHSAQTLFDSLSADLITESY